MNTNKTFIIVKIVKYSNKEAKLLKKTRNIRFSNRCDSNNFWYTGTQQ